VRITSGTYAPTNYQGVIEEIGEMDQSGPAMPPVGPYGTTLAAFNGANPNGTWKLFIQDDLDDDGGELGSWSLTVTTVCLNRPARCCSLLALALSFFAVHGSANPDRD
jgi:hypothetical protein